MLSELQRLLVASCQQADPKAWLAAQLQDQDLPLTAAERQALLAIGDDGLRLSRLLVQKLRLQRLLAGDAAVDAEFTRDPAAFLTMFRAYVAAVPPTAVFPSEEAAAFAAHRRRQPTDR